MQDFPALLSSAAARYPGRKIFILIDALNQLQDVDKARQLDWLPAVYPSNVHVIVSCTPGQCAGDLTTFRPDCAFHSATFCHI